LDRQKHWTENKSDAAKSFWKKEKSEYRKDNPLTWAALNNTLNFRYEFHFKWRFGEKSSQNKEPTWKINSTKKSKLNKWVDDIYWYLLISATCNWVTSYYIHMLVFNAKVRSCYWLELEWHTLTRDCCRFDGTQLFSHFKIWLARSSNCINIDSY